MSLDPQKLSDYGTFWGGVAAILGIIGAGFRFVFITKGYGFATFATKKEVQEKCLKIAEPDGTRHYVHVDEWAPMKKLMEDNLEESRKWRSMAKDWMERP